jgi:hypothetical protein
MKAWDKKYRITIQSKIVFRIQKFVVKTRSLRIKMKNVCVFDHIGLFYRKR